MHVSSCVCGQKRGRKAASASEENEEVPPSVSPTDMPPWVVCSNTLYFWKKGVELPAELQLGAVAAAQVMRIKHFAAEQMEQLQQLQAEQQQLQQQQQEEEEEEEEEEEVAPTPLPFEGPMASWVSPQVAALRDRLAAVPRPDSVARK